MDGEVKVDTKRLIVSALAKFQREHGYAPTYRELADMVEVSHTTVWRALQDLALDNKVAFLTESEKTLTAVQRTVTLTPPVSRSAYVVGSMDDTTRMVGLIDWPEQPDLHGNVWIWPRGEIMTTYDLVRMTRALLDMLEDEIEAREHGD